MKSLAALTVCTAILFSGCGNEDDTTHDSSANNRQTNTSPSGNQNAGDFSTPEDAVKTLVKAAEAKDLDLLSKCFSQEAAGEFQSIVDKSVSPEQLNEFAEFFGGAVVGTAKMNEDSIAYVPVTLTSRDENITMTKEGNDWKVLDF